MDEKGSRMKKEIRRIQATFLEQEYERSTRQDS